jgi:hypothetical protein
MSNLPEVGNVHPNPQTSPVEGRKTDILHKKVSRRTLVKGLVGTAVVALTSCLPGTPTNEPPPIPVPVGRTEAYQQPGDGAGKDPTPPPTPNQLPTSAPACDFGDVSTEDRVEALISKGQAPYLKYLEAEGLTDLEKAKYIPLSFFNIDTYDAADAYDKDCQIHFATYDKGDGQGPRLLYVDEKEGASVVSQVLCNYFVLCKNGKKEQGVESIGLAIPTLPADKRDNVEEWEALTNISFVNNDPDNPLTTERLLALRNNPEKLVEVVAGFNVTPAAQINNKALEVVLKPDQKKDPVAKRLALAMLGSVPNEQSVEGISQTTVNELLAKPENKGKIVFPVRFGPNTRIEFTRHPDRKGYYIDIYDPADSILYLPTNEKDYGISNFGGTYPMGSLKINKNLIINFGLSRVTKQNVRANLKLGDVVYNNLSKIPIADNVSKSKTYGSLYLLILTKDEISNNNQERHAKKNVLLTNEQGKYIFINK